MPIFVLLKRLTCENNPDPDPEKPLNPDIRISERPEKNPASPVPRTVRSDLMKETKNP